MSDLKGWVLASRPKSLTATLAPIFVGTAVAYGTGSVWRPDLTFFALLSTGCIQIGTNLVNDAMDFKKGADTEERIGFRRVTQSGRFSAGQVLRSGMFFFLLAVLFSIPLVVAGGWPIVAVGLVSLCAGYAYTGGPFPLAYQGLGEVFVLIFFGWIAVAGMFYLHGGDLGPGVWIAGTQVGFLANVFLAINNYRDQKTDRVANKRTLAVRFGAGFARLEIAFFALLPFVGLLYWAQQGFFWAALLPLVTLPLALKVVYQIWTTEPGPIFNKFFAQGALLQLAFGVLLSLGLVLR